MKNETLVSFKVIIVARSLYHQLDGLKYKI